MYQTIIIERDAFPKTTIKVNAPARKVSCLYATAGFNDFILSENIGSSQTNKNGNTNERIIRTVGELTIGL